MELNGRIFIPIAFAFGAVLAILLWCLSASFNYPHNAQAAEVANHSSSNHTTKSASANWNTQDCAISQNFPEQILKWCALITHYSAQEGVEANLLAALIYQESGGDPTAYSSSGAVGLMQVMPRDGLAASFNCPNGPCFQNRPSITELQDPEFNISYGTKMLAELIRKNGSIREALKSYGPMGVGYYYSDIVLAIYNRYGS